MSQAPNQPRRIPPGAVAPGSAPRPPATKGPPPALKPQPKPIGPAKMTPAQKQSRDARLGPKMPAGPNEAHKRAEVFGKGHVDARHISITPGQMIDRLHGKDPGRATANPAKAKEVVTKFASNNQANKAGRQILANPKAQAALAAVAKQPVGTVGPKVTLKLPKPVTIDTMRGPKPINVGGKKVVPPGPANLTRSTTRTVEFRPENTPKGPGIHTSFGVPPKKP